MTDYSIYKYHELLEFLDYRYKCSSDKKNYADYLLTMKDKDTLLSLFKIYENVYAKILNYLGTDKITGHSDYDEDLNKCLNENILRIFLNDNNLTFEKCIKYLVNIRNCCDIDLYHQSIVDKAGSIFGSPFLHKAREIIDAKRNYYEAYNECLYTSFETYTNGYKEIADRVKCNFKTIKQAGYVRLIGDYLPVIEKITKNILLFVLAIGLFLLFGFILIQVFKPTDKFGTILCFVFGYFIFYSLVTITNKIIENKSI